MRLALAWLAWALPLLGLWGLLTGSLKGPELWVGCVCAALAASAAGFLREQGLLRFRPRARWLRYAGRVAWRLLTDNLQVLAEVPRRLVHPHREGTFLSVSFPVGDDDAEAIARRTLGTVAISLPPNTYVVDFDALGGRVLVHQLVPSRGAPPEDWRDLL